MPIRSIDPFFRRAFIVTAIVCSLYILYLLTPVIIPFFSAFVLAYLVNPLVTRLSRYMRRWIAIIVVYLAITIGVLVFLWWLVPTVWVQLQALWEYLPRAVSWYNNTAREWVEGKSGNRLHLPLLESHVLSETMVQYLGTNYDVQDAQSLMRKVLTSGLTLVNNAGMIVLLPILTFYFLFNWDKRLQQWKMSLPKQYANKILEITKDCDKALMSFVKGQLLVMILLGIIYAVQLELIGLDLGLTIGMIAGIASFVPYLGFGIGFIAAIVAGIFQFGADWVYLGLIIGAFMVGQAIEGYILQPLLLGDKIGLSPLWVIFSVLAGAALLGFVGMLIALPVSAVLNVLFKHAYAAYMKSDLYKGKRQLKLFD
ncbi:AI-2E family transporter [Psychrobacter sp. I-STPA6b]|uniref:AI-2E family transporter n=1 Tax=Psychrobacter sp. I-STPA6b TaxID=2585718 RepID=UPI001D0C8B4A|nr:AI-2E family transporter [Psychrobacter sp. I-STPA6b]